MRRKKNYLNNKDMLAEIHKSKISYCQYDKSFPEHAQHDAIVYNIDDIFIEETIALARKTRASRIANEDYNNAYDNMQKDDPIPKLAQFKFDPETIPLSELVFRVITYDHIPEEPGRKKNPKTIADHHVRLNFIPFKHYVIRCDENDDVATVLKGANDVTEVLVSHTKDDQFNMTHGKMTNKLAQMFMLMVNKYGQRSNWRGYTYLDEMKGNALLQLSGMGLQFNEAKSNNPFSYYTASISNSFTGVLNQEKKNQNIRDDLLVNAGINPSFTRQLAIEEEIRRMRNEASDD